MCDCETVRSMDVRTPRNVHLSAFYKRSFAFYTVKTRMPVILTSLIDSLVRAKQQIAEDYGEGVSEELKAVIGELSELKYEIQTNKPLKKLNSQAPDIRFYNEYIDEQTSEQGVATHFHTIWLLTECYMYRRIRQMFETKKILNSFDPFRNSKVTAFQSMLPLIDKMGKYFLDIIQNNPSPNKENFIALLKLNLWGNKCDLSLSLGKVSEDATLFDTAALDPYILCDDSYKVWEAISNADAKSNIVDIVFDNAGYEVFTDLCLADYIVSTNLARTVRFHVKSIPWFVSDVMTYDFNWTLDQLVESNLNHLQTLGKRWKAYIANGTWVTVESYFWTLPVDYTYMPRYDKNLYKNLAEAKLVFFKGDLNYRKLFGEKNWDPTTPVNVALQNFNPTKLCTLRTIKADIVCGLKPGIAEEIEAKDADWMGKGDWGLIQFSDKIVPVEQFGK